MHKLEAETPHHINWCKNQPMDQKEENRTTHNQKNISTHMTQNDTKKIAEFITIKQMHKTA